MAPKRKAKAAVKDDDSQNDVKPANKRAKKNTATANDDTPPPASNGNSQKPMSTNVHVPLDDYCSHYSHVYKVYIANDIIYDVSLNQTSSQGETNSNKFYRIQLLVNFAGTEFKCWTRWGRVGEAGQNALLGNGELGDALKHFDKKFKDKTGLTFDRRFEQPKPKKYVFIERSYEPDSDNDGVNKPTSAGAKDEIDSAPIVKTEIPESKLDSRVQSLIQLIFNQEHFSTVLKQMEYDANKLPLGKLSKRTLLQGYQVLKDLADLILSNNAANNAANNGEIARLSDLYYSYIPHSFGRKRPPTISMEPLLKREIELLESLSDMRIAEEIMKDSKRKDLENVNPLDAQFAGLMLSEMTPLSYQTKEFKEIKSYLCNSVGSTHSYFNYEVEDIFRIERGGEFERFDKAEHRKIKNSNRRLLWHGSRTTNFGGILSQGLRIAPPEAPVSGYMFGKGIYLADMSSKSANYCFSSNTNRTGLLLLCEAELGDPMLELTNADANAGEQAKKENKLATHGLGQSIPMKWKDAGCVHKSLEGISMPDCSVAPGQNPAANVRLQYNEYIVYDISQVRLRYLLRVKM